MTGGGGIMGVRDNAETHVLVKMGFGKKVETVLREEHRTMEAPWMKGRENEPRVMISRWFGTTLNLGNFESLRTDVGIQVPATLDTAEQADAFARRWCELRTSLETCLARKIPPPMPTLEGLRPLAEEMGLLPPKK